MALLGWESSRDGRRVLFNGQIVRDLRMLAIEGFTALPRRGIEVGGLLFGEAHSGEIRVGAFEEAPCEHRYGPTYALSQSDREVLDSLLGARREGMAPVIGFFRSFTSRDPVIEAADEEFVRSHFPNGDFLYLMLQPRSARQCLASYWFFRDGQLVAGVDDPPNPFDEPLMTAMEPALETPAAPIAAAPPDPIVEPPSFLPPSYRSQAEAQEALTPVRRRSRWWIPATICLASGLAGAATYEAWTLARTPHWADLHLDLRPAGQRLELTWDPRATRALHPTRGRLQVTDGTVRSDIELDAAQIAAGKYTYMPANPDVAVRLTLYADGQGLAGDSARIRSMPNPIVSAKVAPSARLSGEADRAVPAPASDIQPVPVREVQPSIPEGVRSRLTEEVVIPVEVLVDPRGRVIRVSADTPAQDGVQLFLVERAKKAAWEWRFRPARTKSGTAVAANRTLRFVFTPEALRE